MSIVNILSIDILNNPAPFLSPYEFEITFECLESLENDLEWKLTYVGSATSTLHDQELDSLLVGPIPIGINKFLFQADPPTAELIPKKDILGVTVILLTCAYDSREFVRVGYYVNNELPGVLLREDGTPDVEKWSVEDVQRNILAEKPRVTRFNIRWDGEGGEEMPPVQDDVEEDEEIYSMEEQLDDFLEETEYNEEAIEIDLEEEESSEFNNS
ncbi:hypothetical protein T552_01404 [Pneumocystis carinii B80]|uniref:Anti-silencing function protein 1 n=2 Tax=Pneumocystis carinii TaxID=4754 RepID=A0A0W4ZK73_PNEC8|nr:hypothetical protein T552_01404 [Pneumocystis carinii B80]AGE91721.1 nucleosome assembly factor 1 [Pneumocystis carinii]KTW28774.1 hypothetical protein T552_01404 [Pneumocystis carinii B80]